MQARLYEVYDKANNVNMRLDGIKVGDLVVTLFTDNMWYRYISSLMSRARILLKSKLENRNRVNQLENVFLIDIGRFS